MKFFYTDETGSRFDIKFFENLNLAVLADLEEAGYEFSIKEEAELSLLMTDNENIKSLNSDYRGKDYPTDVLSFPMEEENMLGDIAISVDKAHEQAGEVGIALEREMAFLYIHGLLHLLGFDHETSPEDEKEMFDLQERILKKLVDNKEIS